MEHMNTNTNNNKGNTMTKTDAEQIVAKITELWNQHTRESAEAVMLMQCDLTRGGWYLCTETGRLVPTADAYVPSR
jgi:hypothetical protein